MLDRSASTSRPYGARTVASPRPARTTAPRAAASAASSARSRDFPTPASPPYATATRSPSSSRAQAPANTSRVVTPDHCGAAEPGEPPRQRHDRAGTGRAFRRMLQRVLDEHEPGRRRRWPALSIRREPGLERRGEPTVQSGEGLAKAIAVGEHGRRCRGQGGREHDRARVDVGALVDHLADLALLRRHVPVRAGPDGEDGPRSQIAREPEVGQHQLLVGSDQPGRAGAVGSRRGGRADQQVGRLDVPVDDAERVRGADAAGQLVGEHERVVVGQGQRAVGPALPQPLGERAAGRVVHDEEGPVLELADVVDPDETRAVDAPQDPGLAHEPLAHVGIEAPVLGEDLERDRGLRVPRRRPGPPSRTTRSRGRRGCGNDR